MKGHRPDLARRCDDERDVGGRRRSGGAGRAALLLNATTSGPGRDDFNPPPDRDGLKPSSPAERWSCCCGDRVGLPWWRHGIMNIMLVVGDRRMREIISWRRQFDRAPISASRRVRDACRAEHAFNAFMAAASQEMRCAYVLRHRHLFRVLSRLEGGQPRSIKRCDSNDRGGMTLQVSETLARLEAGSTRFGSTACLECFTRRTPASIEPLGVVVVRSREDRRWRSRAPRLLVTATGKGGGQAVGRIQRPPAFNRFQYHGISVVDPAWPTS